MHSPQFEMDTPLSDFQHSGWIDEDHDPLYRSYETGYDPVPKSSTTSTTGLWAEFGSSSTPSLAITPVPAQQKKVPEPKPRKDREQEKAKREEKRRLAKAAAAAAAANSANQTKTTPSSASTVNPSYDTTLMLASDPTNTSSYGNNAANSIYGNSLSSTSGAANVYGMDSSGSMTNYQNGLYTNMYLGSAGSSFAGKSPAALSAAYQQYQQQYYQYCQHYYRGY
jgi:hypothetical protein